jgi:hypothetical protein
MKMNTKDQQKKQLLKFLGAKAIRFHGSGSGDIDIIIIDRGKKGVISEYDTLCQVRGLWPNILHIYSSANAPAWLLNH